MHRTDTAINKAADIKRRKMQHAEPILHGIDFKDPVFREAKKRKNNGEDPTLHQVKFSKLTGDLDIDGSCNIKINALVCPKLARKIAEKGWNIPVSTQPSTVQRIDSG